MPEDIGEVDATAESPAEGIQPAPGEGIRRRRRRVRRRNRNRQDHETSSGEPVPPPVAASEVAPTLWAATEENFEHPESEAPEPSPDLAVEEPAPAFEEREPQRVPAFAEAEPPVEHVPEPEPSSREKEEEKQPAGPPRRGWWQRLVE